MAIRPQIQALLDAVDLLTTAVQKVDTELATEQKTIADLTAKIAAGGDLSADEVTALADAAKKVSDAATAASAALPAVATATTAAAAG